MNIISVVNQKGGVAKTTTTANLGASLADKGYRTLLIDLDPQANLTLGLRREWSDLPYGLQDVLLDCWARPLSGVVRQSGSVRRIRKAKVDAQPAAKAKLAAEISAAK